MNDKIIFDYIIDNKLDMERVINDYSNYIYAIIKNYYFKFSAEDTEEIVFDVFLTLWNSQSKLNCNNKLSPYIAGITRNLVRKKYKNIDNNYNIEDYEMELPDIENIELSCIDKEKNRIINEEINCLKNEDKSIFNMYYYYNKSIKEISNFNKMSESKIKSKLFRIRKRITNRLKKGGYYLSEK